MLHAVWDYQWASKVWNSLIRPELKCKFLLLSLRPWVKSLFKEVGQSEMKTIGRKCVIGLSVAVVMAQ